MPLARRLAGLSSAAVVAALALPLAVPADGMAAKVPASSP
jgi:hypothetical protein